MVVVHLSEALSAEGAIVTAGGIDTSHTLYISTTNRYSAI